MIAPALSPAAALVYESINAATSSNVLDDIVRAIWRDYGNAAFTDDEATFLSNAIERRRPAKLPQSDRRNEGATTAVRRCVGRIGSRFTPRPARKRLTDDERTKRRHRKRMLGGSSAMPDALRHHYTEGERSVMCVVAGEVKRHGICDLSIDEIADRSGVGRTTVQNAMHEARRLGHVVITERPRRGAKNLPNVVRIASPEWLVWIKRRPAARCGIGSNSFRNENTTKIISIRKKEPANEDGMKLGPAPPQTLCRRRA